MMPAMREQDQRQQRRAGGERVRAHRAEDDQDEQDVDDIVSDAHGISPNGS